jgi:hypothetical protein
MIPPADTFDVDQQFKVAGTYQGIGRRVQEMADCRRDRCRRAIAPT